MAKKEWLNWLKCNILEIIILILVLVLVVKAFSVPATEVTVKETVDGTLEEVPLEASPTTAGTIEAGRAVGEGVDVEQPTPEIVGELPIEPSIPK